LHELVEASVVLAADPKLYRELAGDELEILVRGHAEVVGRAVEVHAARAVLLDARVDDAVHHQDLHLVRARRLVVVDGAVERELEGNHAPGDISAPRTA